MPKRRRRTSTPTIMVFGNEVANPAYDPLAASQDRERVVGRAMSPTPPVPVQVDAMGTQDRLDDLIGDEVDPVEFGEFIGGLYPDEPDDAEFIDTLARAMRLPGETTEQRQQAVVADLDRAFLVVRQGYEQEVASRADLDLDGHDDAVGVSWRDHDLTVFYGSPPSLHPDY